MFGRNADAGIGKTEIVVILVFAETTDVDVCVDGKRTETYQCEFVSDFMQLQHETQQMASADVYKRQVDVYVGAGISDGVVHEIAEDGVE